MRTGEEGTEGDEMAGWRHQFSGHERWANSGGGQGDREVWCAVVYGAVKVRLDLVAEQEQPFSF